MGELGAVTRVCSDDAKQDGETLPRCVLEGVAEEKRKSVLSERADIQLARLLRNRKTVQGRCKRIGQADMSGPYSLPNPRLPGSERRPSSRAVGSVGRLSDSTNTGRAHDVYRLGDRGHGRVLYGLGTNAEERMDELPDEPLDGVVGLPAPFCRIPLAFRRAVQWDSR